MKELNKLLDKELKLLLLESYKGILSKEMIEYLDSLIELEFSVIKDYIALDNREILTELSIFRYASIYNIYNRTIKLIKENKLPLEINKFDKPIDVRENSLNLSFVTKSKKRINVFEYDYNYHSPYRNKIPEYYYNRNLGGITIYQTLESKEQREKELSKQMEQQKKIYEANLIKTLCDIECELDICEQIMSDQYNDIALIQDIKKEYKRLKTKYTKTKHELDIFCMNNM